jgi:hypothetical protein
MLDDRSGRERRRICSIVGSTIAIVIGLIVLIIVWDHLKEEWGAKNVSIGVGAFLAIWIGCEFYRRMCPECGKLWGLRYTGEKENLNAGKFYWFLADNEYMYRCKHCGCEVWKKRGSGGC